VDDEDRREWLLDRLDVAARDFANADLQIKQIRWGRQLGLLEVGTRFGYWSRRSADRYSDAAYFGHGQARARRILRR
jgi:hypothetical protein